MSFQVGTSCYPSELSAAIATATESAGAVVQHGPTAYVVEAASIGATSITYAFHPVGGGSPLTLATPYNAQPCQLLSMADGLQIGWMIAGAWIGAYCLIKIKDALFTGESENGNT